MVNVWKLAFGLVLLVAGLVVFWQNYTTIASCGTVMGRIATFFSSLIGGQGAQACYNAQIGEVGGLVVALIGLVVLYSEFGMKKTGRK
jgi:hypothetical protein